MRRGRREKESNGFRHFAFLSGGIVLIMLITFVVTLIVYNNKLKKSSYSTLTTEKIADLVPNITENTDEQLEQASSKIGKSIQEAINEIEVKEKTTDDIEIENKKNKNNQNEIKIEKENNVPTNVESQIAKDPEFINPVEGEIIRNYAKDSLIYSETLEEWVTHFGMDIKAERTTVVKAAEAGTIVAIKNDPRYGLTVVIEHVNGFKSVYSNLLTTEFVSEGEKVEKGQSIGTVGNSASFEIVDEPHLHFEIIKDGENVDPNIYLK